MAYTELDLRKLKTQALKDVWHSMIGKEAGIKNTTGLKTGEEILAAILKGQDDPGFLEPFLKVRQTTHKAKEPAPVVEMPKGNADSGETKKQPQKRGPKPKANPIVMPKAGKVRTEAIESTELPLEPRTVEKTKVKKFHIGSTLVFIDLETNTVYEAIGNTPGSPCGRWDPISRQVCPE
jgi:hypothetical protein